MADVAAGCVIGIDIGGTKLLAGAVSDGAVIARERREVAGLATADLLDAVVDAIAALGVEYERVGCGIPALLDRSRGVVVSCVHLPLAGVDFAAELAARLGSAVPVVVDNDANCALLAEARLGAARGVSRAVLLTIGTGIGGGLLIDGEVERGALGAGAEFGHMTLAHDGPRCTGDCPGRGCFETYVSGRALLRARGTGLEEDEAIEAMGEMLGIGLASIANALNPERFVIGGGIGAAFGERLLAPARVALGARALAPSGRAQVVAAELGEDAGMVGAALL